MFNRFNWFIRGRLIKVLEGELAMTVYLKVVHFLLFERCYVVIVFSAVFGRRRYFDMPHRKRSTLWRTYNQLSLLVRTHFLRQVSLVFCLFGRIALNNELLHIRRFFHHHDRATTFFGTITQAIKRELPDFFEGCHFLAHLYLPVHLVGLQSFVHPLFSILRFICNLSISLMN